MILLERKEGLSGNFSLLSSVPFVGGQQNNRRSKTRETDLKKQTQIFPCHMFSTIFDSAYEEN